MGYEGATEGSFECKGAGLSFSACNYISSLLWHYLLLLWDCWKITTNMVTQRIRINYNCWLYKKFIGKKAYYPKLRCHFWFSFGAKPHIRNNIFLKVLGFSGNLILLCWMLLWSDRYKEESSFGCILVLNLKLGECVLFNWYWDIELLFPKQNTL